MAFRLHSARLVLVLLLPVLAAQAQQTVCYFGDSITEGWIDAERRPHEAYPFLVDSALHAAGMRFRSVVSAKGGETSEDALFRFEREVLAQAPDVVVFAFGSNDYYVWGEPPAPRVPLARFLHNCGILIDALARSGSRVIVLPPPPVREERFHRYADSLLYVPFGGAARLRDDYAAALNALAERKRCVGVLRLDSLLLADTAALGFDGVHPSATGHRRIADRLTGMLGMALGQRCEGETGLDGIRMYPLPFNRLRLSVSSISFPVETTGAHVLRISDAAGRIVKTFVYSAHATGSATVLWNGTDDRGTRVGPGAYILTVLAPLRRYRPYSIIVL